MLLLFPLMFWISHSHADPKQVGKRTHTHTHVKMTFAKHVGSSISQPHGTRKNLSALHSERSEALHTLALQESYGVPRAA